jgi:ABC-type protease/lipase transport system fused ATPase/permease subunit
VMVMRNGQIDCFGPREQVEAWAQSRATPAEAPAAQPRLQETAS